MLIYHVDQIVMWEQIEQVSFFVSLQRQDVRQWETDGNLCNCSICTNDLVCSYKWGYGIFVLISINRSFVLSFFIYFVSMTKKNKVLENDRISDMKYFVISERQIRNSSPKTSIYHWLLSLSERIEGTRRSSWTYSRFSSFLYRRSIPVKNNDNTKRR